MMDDKAVRVETREEARAAGRTKYYTGVRCVQGHASQRSVATGVCDKCKLGWAQSRYARNPVKTISRNVASKKRVRDRNPKFIWAQNACIHAKRRARRRGLPFNLTTEIILSLCVDVCPALGVPLDYRGNGTRGSLSGSPSMDRIKGELGYVIGNVAIICRKANSIKNNACPDEIEAVAAWARKVTPGC